MENSNHMDNNLITANNNINNITNTFPSTTTTTHSSNSNTNGSTSGEYSGFNSILHKSYFKIAIIGAHNVGKTSFIIRYVESRFLESYYPTNRENHFTKTVYFNGKNKIISNIYGDDNYDEYDMYQVSNDPSFQVSNNNSNNSGNYTIVDRNDYALDLEEDTITLEFIDTIGQESKGDSYLNISYYKSFMNLNGCILCYDINNLDSFLVLKSIWDNITTQLDLPTKNFPILLLGMKCDIHDTTSDSPTNNNNSNQITRQVSWDQGKQLSKKLNSLFFECSSKDNYNVNLSMSEFIRLMKIKQDKLLNIQNNSNNDKCTIM